MAFRIPRIVQGHLAQEQLLIEPTEHDVAVAWEGYERAEAASAGIVDHVSFVVMRRLGIGEAFTNDEVTGCSKRGFALADRRHRMRPKAETADY